MGSFHSTDAWYSQIGLYPTGDAAATTVAAVPVRMRKATFSARS